MNDSQRFFLVNSKYTKTLFPSTQIVNDENEMEKIFAQSCKNEVNEKK
jgi:hypothetical protein